MRIQNIVTATIFLLVIAIGVYFPNYGPALISSSIAKEAEKGGPLISPTEPRERDYYTPR